jgi:glycerol-3-phosphate acyltransferase PlsY
MPIYIYIIVTVAAYFLGAVPFGYIYAKIRGVDIRKVGSGNIGATNVGRQFGFLGGFLPVFLLDALKGALPVLAVRLIGVEGFDTNAMDMAMLITGIVAFLGHIFPIYLGFKGGKGVATAAGIFIVIAPIEVGIALGVFLILYGITRIVAIGSIAAAIAFPVIVAILSSHRLVLLIVAIAAAVVIVITHRSNIAKLLGKKDDTAKEESPPDQP